jgi:hypothetical protein
LERKTEDQPPDLSAEQNLSDPRGKALSRVLFSRTFTASNLLDDFDILPRTVVVIVVIVALLVVLVVVLVVLVVTLVCVVVLIIIIL